MNTYTLDYIFSLTPTLSLELYRQLTNNPYAGSGWGAGRLRQELIIETFRQHLLPQPEMDIYNDQGLEVLMYDIGLDNLNRLVDAYNLTNRIGGIANKPWIALQLYRNGISFHDLMYAFSNEPDMITGNLLYTPKPGEKIEGIYERSGKVRKDHINPVEPFPENPYSYLPPAIISRIAEERDIQIARDKHQIVYANVLHNYDQILPEWSNRAKANPQTRNQLYYAAGDAHIDINVFNTQTMSDLDLKKLVMIGRLVLSPRNGLPTRKIYQQYPSQKSLKFDEAYRLAKDDGYIFSVNNIGFPFSVFGENKNKDEIVGYMAEIALYPPNISGNDYFIITTTNKNILKKLLKQKYNTDDVMLLNDNHLIFIATRGYLLPNSGIQEAKKRYDTIKTYPITLIEKLRKVYHIHRDETEDNVKYLIASESPVHPLEPLMVHFKLNVIDNIEMSNYQKNTMASQYSKSVGMLIPSNIDRKADYFWRNIHLYRNVLTRSSTIEPFDKNLLSGTILSDLEVKRLLRNYTDREIFQYTGVYLPYNGRMDILDNVNTTRRNNSFFIPTVRACANEETITGLEETNDTGVFIIGYGTIFEYFCYDLDDFLQSFREYPIEGMENTTAFRFRKPNDPGLDFTLEEIQGLVGLLEMYPNIEGVPEMIDILRNGLRRVREMTDYDRQVLAQFNTLSGNDIPLVREWLMQLFNTGMYMRRWRGPPYPYPYTDAQTQGPDPNLKVNEELVTLGYYPLARDAQGGYPDGGVGGITAQLSQNGKNFVNNIRSIEYVRGEAGILVPRQETRTIGYYLDRVRKGNMCIRMASSIFTGTASYYLGVFFREDIPNFDPTRVDRIV